MNPWLLQYPLKIVAYKYSKEFVMASKEIYDLQGLFEAVQLNAVFTDGKTFVDCIPKFSLEIIEQQWLAQKNQQGFDLAAFIKNNFDEPPVFAANYQSKKEIGRAHV